MREEERAASAGPGLQAERHMPTPARTEPPLVLVVDDDPELRVALEDVLTLEGFRVATASNGAEALTYLDHASRPPDVILMDLLMPVMDGWQFLAVRARRHHLRHIPVLVASATPSPTDAPAGVEMLCKPVHLDQLLGALSRYVA